MNLPNLKHLHYLVVLHQYQHFHRAAAACFISQSTLSSAIIKLEESLNCQLIERDHKAFIFTAQGEEIVKMAQQLVNNAVDIVQFGQAQGNAEQGSLNIGSIPTIAPFLLQDLAIASKREMPKLSLYFTEDTTDNLLQALAQGKIDLAILALPIDTGQFKSKKLAKDCFYLAGNKKLIDDFSVNHEYKDIPEQSVFMLSHEHCLSEHAISACKLTEASRIHQFSSSSLAMLVQMTAFHNGVTFLPKMAVDKGVGKEEKLTIKSFEQDIYRDIGMLWRPTSMRHQTYVKIGELVTRILS